MRRPVTIEIARFAVLGRRKMKISRIAKSSLLVGVLGGIGARFLSILELEIIHVSVVVLILMTGSETGTRMIKNLVKTDHFSRNIFSRWSVFKPGLVVKNPFHHVDKLLLGKAGIFVVIPSAISHRI